MNPVEAQRRSAESRSRRRREFVDPDSVLKALLESGARQGLSRVWLELERRRHDEHLSVEQLARRRDALEAEIADREQYRGLVEEANESLLNHQEQLEETCDALEERESELRRRVETDGLETILEEAGEEATERALASLGWLDEEGRP
jgi:hypothetical protein